VTKARDPRHAPKLFRKALADTSGRWETFHFTSRDNPHISAEALDEITGDMSRLSIRQEIEAEDDDAIPGALWNLLLIEQHRVYRAPDLTSIVVGVDPPASSDGAECGIVGAGRGVDDHGYTLADLSVQGSPATWAAAVIRAYGLLKADRVVAEKNQGGEMVEYTIRQTATEIDGVRYDGRNLPITLVSASRGKVTRAEPIAALMEQGRDHHVGMFSQLEDQMCSYVPGAISPDRMDARVWAYTQLFPLIGGTNSARGAFV
jgi:phage terminase large subunit-like protein